MTSSNGTVVFGGEGMELWGTTLTGPDMDDTKFRVKITLGSNKTSYQTLKDFGFNITYPNLLTKIEVVPKGISIQTRHISTRLKSGVIMVPVYCPILLGTQAYDTTTDRMVYF
jgi:hypothetical protein